MNKKALLGILCMLIITAYPEQNIMNDDAVEYARLIRANKLMDYPEGTCFWKPSKYNGIGQVIGSGTKAIVAFHGLGDCAHAGYASYFRNCPDTAVIVPDMPYTSRLLNKGLGKISLGGTPDVIAALLIIDRVCKAGYTEICLYGFSCGGAIITNTLYAILHPEKYQHIFPELGIEPEVLRRAIRVCILDRPFASFDHSVKAIVGRFMASIVRAIGTKGVMSSILKSNYPGNRIVFDGEIPIESAAVIKHVPILVHVGKRDKVVGHHGPNKLYANLKKNNPEHVLLLETDADHLSVLSEPNHTAMMQFVQKYF